MVTLSLELDNALEQLGDGGRDVGQLDDVALGSQLESESKGKPVSCLIIFI